MLRAKTPTEGIMTAPAADPNRGHLFYRYAFWLLAALAVVVLTHRGFEAWSSYQEQRALLILVQRQQAEAAAGRVGQFVKEIESQMRWLVQLPTSANTLDEWYVESVRVLRQAPAITELSRIDPAGRERVRVSRIAFDSVGGEADLSGDPKFVEAVANRHYFSPVYFRGDSEPYMTLAIAGIREEYGVVAAEVNLKFIWDALSDFRLSSIIFVIDTNGRLVTHPDISLVLRKTDLSDLRYVQAVLSQIRGRSLGERFQDTLASVTYAPVPSLGWILIMCHSQSSEDRSTFPFCVSH